MPQGCSQVAWCPGVHPESLDGCFRRWKITQCFCCLWELIKRLKLKLWGLGVRPASEERLWDLVLTGWRASEPETCRDVHWSSFGRIGEHLTWRRVCGKSRKKHPEFYFSHRGQWKRNPSGYQKWRCLFCFVRQGKHITFTVFFTLGHATFESQKLKDHNLFFLPLPSLPLGLLGENIKVIPQLSQAGQCPDRKQSCGGGQMGFDVLWMKTWGHVQGPDAENREYLAKPRGISCSLPEWVFKYPEKDKRNSRSMGRPKCLCPQKSEDVCRDRAVCV